jgi:hypothetical protein
LRRRQTRYAVWSASVASRQDLPPRAVHRKVKNAATSRAYPACVFHAAPTISADGKNAFNSTSYSNVGEIRNGVRSSVSSSATHDCDDVDAGSSGET